MKGKQDVILGHRKTIPGAGGKPELGVNVLTGEGCPC